MKNQRDSKIYMIPLDHITVLNPRERGKRKFKQIVDNIASLGLKKPITVTPKESTNGAEDYHLVCGQGRYEAYQLLGESEIPALIVHVTKEELLLMSLVENLARRQHSSIELVRDISAMRERGYSFSQIAAKTALDVSYVRGMIKLLNKGEERLLQAVEKGKIPISVAVIIASSEDQQIQKALTDAYENNVLRGKKLLAARRLVEKRKTDGKGIHSGNKKRNGDALSSEKLLRAYQDETTRQRTIIQKSRLCETRLLFAVTALRRLFEDENFINLLRAESLETLPTYLANELHGESK
ncbi:plasmid partitioning protein RepB C-terminal domain-containing protein [Gimesia sp.]|uniref:plasmid partitioning protein RepB C-terminal domain-containing protein n=1 Tax=Gimesia sp. TaxID=2024833 RepID=UPI000C59D7AB|nr:plasmid partitioning protein RepB C-terminal domain-containing protein [Gimesia sp.]MAX35355.1 chromosome partitioning protein ParB [Gimesia sp.]HAH45641.1 chromosome partitioning protein ParB [Planctomycetaceae bacterium]HBL46852.1 chromosome partitioning protein ParB [Planctomycetaceae bacterium]|tara:strand:+ start:66 stop:956 length:891 start_codon:yes stop_codon:yes gene_type:complete